MKLFLALLACLVPYLLSIILQLDVELFVFSMNGAILLLSLLIIIQSKLSIESFSLVSIFLMIISCFALISYSDSVIIGSEISPFIPGGDGEKYFAQAKLLSQGDPLNAPNVIKLNYLGYQIILGYWFKLFGTNLFYGIALNYAILIFSFLLVSISSLKIAKSKKAGYITLYLAFLSTPFLYMGVLLLKDVWILFALSLALKSIISFKQNENVFISIFWIIVSLVILGMTRLPFLFIVPCLFFLYGRLVSLKNIIFAGLLGSILIALLPIMLMFTNHSFDNSAVTQTVLETSFVQEKLNEDSNGGTVKMLIDGYTEKPIIQRLIFLPIPVLIQFVTPFDFWNISLMQFHFYYFVSKNLNVLWFGGIGVLFLFTIFNFKRIGNKNALRFFTFGVIIYFSIAFIYGGTVPRYSSPAILFMLPACSLLISKALKDNVFKKELIMFYLRYYTVGLFLGLFYILSKAL